MPKKRIGQMSSNQRLLLSREIRQWINLGITALGFLGLLKANNTKR